jgi:hypothetical protein
VTLWSGRETLRHRLRLISTIVLVGLIVAAFVIWIVRGLETAANFAQVVSVIGLLSLAGTLFTTPRPERSAAPVVEPVPGNQATKAPSAQSSSLPQRLVNWWRSLGASGPLSSRDIWFVALAVAAGLSMMLLLLVLPSREAINVIVAGPTNSTNRDEGGKIRQNLVVIRGPKPVLFDNGTTWKWLDLPKGETVVTFSPGGGTRNDGLRGLEGSMYQTGNCNSKSSDVYWSFSGDGHFLGDDSYVPEREISLPDHVDEIVLTIKATYDPNEKCTLGLEWKNPSIERRKPLLPEPSPSPS